jgi:hypothetical protein
MVRLPRGFHLQAAGRQSGKLGFRPGWRGSGAQPISRTPISYYRGRITGVPLTGGQGQSVVGAGGGSSFPVYGTDREATWPVVQAAIGNMHGFRGYNGSGDGFNGVPSFWPGNTVVSIPAGVTLSCISIQPDITMLNAGSLDSHLAAFFAAVPAGQLVSAWEEGETYGGAFTTSAYIAGLARMHTIFRANAPASAKFGQIVSNASAYVGNAGYPLHQWMCTTANGGVQMDYYGMDSYPQSPADTVAANLSATIAQMTAAGAAPPYAICECNTFSYWTAGTQASWFAGLWAAARAGNYLCMLSWWNPTAGDAQQIWPPSSATIAELAAESAQAASGTGGAGGQAVVQVSPQGLGTVWYPAQATISTTSGAADTSTCAVYLGPQNIPTNLVGFSYSGGGDTVSLAVPALSPGQILTAVWSGGHAGDIATMNVVGTMDALTTGGAVLWAPGGW